MTVKRHFTAAVFLHPSAERGAAINRIVAAIGKEPDSRERLASDICQAALYFAQMRDAKDAMSAGTRRLRARIREHLEKAVKLIDADPNIKEIAGASSLPFLVDFLRNCENWHRWDDRQKKKFAKNQQAKTNVIRVPTPLEYLAGASLPITYERRFGAEATFSRPEDEPESPLIYFIEATLKELSLPSNRHSIGRAITRLRKQWPGLRTLYPTLKAEPLVGKI